MARIGGGAVAALVGVAVGAVVVGGVYVAARPGDGVPTAQPPHVTPAPTTSPTGGTPTAPAPNYDLERVVDAVTPINLYATASIPWDQVGVGWTMLEYQGDGDGELWLVSPVGDVFLASAHSPLGDNGLYGWNASGEVATWEDVDDSSEIYRGSLVAYDLLDGSRRVIGRGLDIGGGNPIAATAAQRVFEGGCCGAVWLNAQNLDGRQEGIMFGNGASWAAAPESAVVAYLIPRESSSGKDLGWQLKIKDLDTGAVEDFGRSASGAGFTETVGFVSATEVVVATANGYVVADFSDGSVRPWLAPEVLRDRHFGIHAGRWAADNFTIVSLDGSVTREMPSRDYLERLSDDAVEGHYVLDGAAWSGDILTQYFTAAYDPDYTEADGPDDPGDPADDGLPHIRITEQRVVMVNLATGQTVADFLFGPDTGTVGRVMSFSG